MHKRVVQEGQGQHGRGAHSQVAPWPVDSERCLCIILYSRRLGGFSRAVCFSHSGTFVGWKLCGWLVENIHTLHNCCNVATLIM